jgi:two-component system response regulator NreC
VRSGAPFNTSTELAAVDGEGVLLRVVIADDHAMFREGVRTLLERAGIEVSGEAGDGREAVRLANELTPDVAVLDLSMPAMNGIEAARDLARSAPQVRTVLLTMFSEQAYVLEALRAGVRGYVLKTQAAPDLIDAIRQVMRGSIYLSSGISEVVLNALLEPSAPIDPLTGRELQVLQLVAEGRTAREVASALGLSPKTAESHRNRIMRKLDIHDTAGLVRYAVRRGLVTA